MHEIIVPPPTPQHTRSLWELTSLLHNLHEVSKVSSSLFHCQQATGLKGEIATEQAAKRHKVGSVADISKASTPSFSGPCTGVASPKAEVVADCGKIAENVVSESSKTNKMVTLKESSSSKQSIRPLAPVGVPYVMNKFKLDNRPTAFKIIPPLPAGLADVIFFPLSICLSATLDFVRNKFVSSLHASSMSTGFPWGKLLKCVIMNFD